MNIPPKYEDVVAQLDAAQTEIKCLKAVLNGMEFKQVDDMVLDGVDACLFLGQESARIIKGIQAERDALREELAKFKAGCVDLSSQVRELEHKMDYYKGEGMRADALQQRLAVAEQRASKLEGLLREASSDELFPIRQRLWMRIEAALKPAAEGEGS